MNRLVAYLNPFSRLGLRSYSMGLPLMVTIVTSIIIELIVYYVLQNPMAVGVFAIFIFPVLIIYFSFRDGIKGGLVTTAVTVLYYGYIMVSRNYRRDRLISGIETTIVLTILYLALATVIGWLKETLDTLIEKEKEARQAAEEGQLRLQAILDQLPVGVVLVGAKDLMMEGNHYVEKILGRKIKGKLQTEQSYRSPHAIKNNKGLLAKDWPIVRAIKKGEVVNGEEMEYLKEDKKRIFLRVNAAPVRNKRKQIIAAVSTFDDITTERETELRKDDFVNMASHELKTPVTSMKLYIDSLLGYLKKQGDMRAVKTLTSIKNQTEKLQEIINDLLDVTRIQTGKLRLNREEFNINELVEETIDMLQETSNHRLVKSRSTRVNVMADRFRIYQVLTNLITNAIKYSPADKPIKVRVEKNESQVIVSVQDFGIGISKDQHKKIFDRLYQVTEAKEKTFPGLGMGLYISKEIIRRHRGKIWVEGEKDKGSTFYFALPIKNG